MSEYLLLIIYIVITVHDMLRLRKARKTLPKRTNSIIKYRYEKIIPIVSNEEIFQEDSKQKSAALKLKQEKKANKLIKGNGFSAEQKLVLAQSLQINMQQNSLSKVKTILNRLKQAPGDGGKSTDLQDASLGDTNHYGGIANRDDVGMGTNLEPSRYGKSQILAQTQIMEEKPIGPDHKHNDGTVRKFGTTKSRVKTTVRRNIPPVMAKITGTRKGSNHLP